MRPRVIQRKLKALKKLGRSNHNVKEISFLPRGSFFNYGVKHSWDYNRVLGKKIYEGGDLQKKLFLREVTGKNPAFNKFLTKKAKINLAASSSKGARSALYHETGHGTGRPYSQPMDTLISIRNRKRDTKGRKLYASGKSKRGRSAMFTEEVRAWKNALDMTRGTGQKRRINPMRIKFALTRYEKGLGLPKGTGGYHASVLLRYNRMYNKNKNMISKPHGKAGTRRTEHFKIKRGKQK